MGLSLTSPPPHILDIFIVLRTILELLKKLQSQMQLEDQKTKIDLLAIK